MVIELVAVSTSGTLSFVSDPIIEPSDATSGDDGYSGIVVLGPRGIEFNGLGESFNPDSRSRVVGWNTVCSQSRHLSGL